MTVPQPRTPPRPHHKALARNGFPGAPLCHRLCVGKAGWERQLTAASLDRSGFRGILSSALRAELTAGFSAENSPKTAQQPKPASFTLLIRLSSWRRLWVPASATKPAQRSGTRSKGTGVISPTRHRAPQIGLVLLQAGRCTRETLLLPPAQAASLLLLLPQAPGDRKHQPDLICTVGKPGNTSCFSREKRRNIQSLRLEEEPKPNLWLRVGSQAAIDQYILCTSPCALST